MKYLTLLALAVSSLVTTSCLSPAQKVQAKALLVQAGTQLSKDLAANAASTSAQLIQLQITDLNTKLDARLAALGDNPDPTKVAEITSLKAALKSGSALTAQLQQELQKVLKLDAAPPIPVAIPPDTSATGTPAP